MTKGKRIRHLRESLSISQTDLAKSVGISKQTLYKYENDIITNIPSDIIEKLAGKLRCSPAYIMGWDDQNQRILEYAKRLSHLNDDQLETALKYIDFIEKEGEK